MSSDYNIVQRDPASGCSPELEPRFQLDLLQVGEAFAGGELDDLHLRLPDRSLPGDDASVSLGSGEGDDAGFVGFEVFGVDPAANDPEREEIKRIARGDAVEFGGCTGEFGGEHERVGLRGRDEGQVVANAGHLPRRVEC